MDVIYAVTEVKNLLILVELISGHLKGDCIDGSSAKGTRQSSLFSFALETPPGHKLSKNPELNLRRK